MKDLRVNISGNQTGFQQVLNSVKHEGKKFSEEWSATSLGKRMVLGAGSLLGFEAVKASFESFIERASSLRQLSEQLEMSAEATQKWEKAADRLGLSFGIVQNVLQAIGAKRLEAIFDPKVADQFQRLGISRQSVLNTEGLDNSDFSKLVYKAAQSESGRGIFAEMFGNRALKTLGTGKLVDQMTPTFSAEALEGAHQAEIAEKRFRGFIGKWWGDFVTNMAEGVDAIREGRILAPGAKSFLTNLRHPINWLQGSIASGINSQMGVIEPKAAANAAAAESGSPESPHDPLESVKADKQLQREMQIDAAERGQHERERQLMTIGQRRVSIMQDMLRVRRQIEQLEDAKAPENLKNAEEIADWEAKRQESLAGLRGQLSGYKAELRERPVFGGAADSLSRLGLFSSISAMTGPPGSGVNELVSLNKRMEHHLFKIANKQDPHNP